jgi:hypothetical protein
MTYVSMAKRLKLCRQMKLILLRNQERMKKATAATVTDPLELTWD